MKFVFALALVAVCVILMNARPNSKRAADEARLHKRDGGKREHSSKAVDEDEALPNAAEEKESTHPDENPNQNDERKKRAATDPGTVKHWPDGKMAYKFEPENYGDEERKGKKLRDIVKEAADEWNYMAGVQIELKQSATENYIEIRNGDDGCWAFIGYQGKKPGQNVMVLQKSSCFSYGVILHEFGHALGLIHEAKRADAKDNIEIETGNIKPKKVDQFKPDPNARPIDSVYPHATDYDFCSIMHYSPTAFSKDGSDTIKLLDRDGTRKDLNDDILPCLGSQLGLSLRDGVGVATMYGNLASDSSKCDNAGYLLTADNTCRCSNLFEGNKCQTPISDPACGTSDFDLKVGDVQEIKTPNFGKGNYPTDTTCTWAFTSEVGTKLCVVFPNGFKVENPGSSGKCSFDWIEIVLDERLTRKTKRYCGKGDAGVYEIFENWIAVVFHSDDAFPEPGFRLAVVALDEGETEDDCQKKVEAMKSTGGGGGGDDDDDYGYDDYDY